MDKPGHQEVRQLDEESVVAHFEDARREGVLPPCGRELILEKLELLELDGVFFSIGGDAFGCGDMVRDGSRALRNPARAW